MRFYLCRQPDVKGMKSKFNRRAFLGKSVGLTATAFLARCGINPDEHKDQSSPVKEGEEWKKVYVDQKDEFLGSDQEVVHEALENIEKYRKRDFVLRFVDANQRPISKMPVEIKQVSHDFDWGCSAAGQICDDNHERFERDFSRLFNSTTAKCYWDEGWHQPIEHIEGQRKTDVFEREIKWGLANLLKVKGHPLVWTVSKAIPDWLGRYPYHKQMEILEAHVRSLIYLGGSRIKQWDLCNEMLWEPSLRNLPNRKWPHLEEIEEILSYLEPAVHWAKDENPLASYVLNDYGLVKTYAPGVTAQQQRDRYVALIEEMDKRGCMPDAIGTQCHVAGWYSGKEFRQHLDDLSKTGLPIQITEFWARLENAPDAGNKPEKQIREERVQYVRNMYTIAFGHPAVNHFTWWGRDMFDDQLRPNEVYYALDDLLNDQWKTHLKSQSDNHGEIRGRGFKGKYAVLFKDQKGNLRKDSFSLSDIQSTMNIRV